LDQVRVLVDPGFDGGLTVREMALARSLADHYATQAPGDFGVCGEPDPDKPDNDYKALEHATPESVAAQMPAPFTALAQLMAHGSPAQKAVISESVILMGKRAGVLEFLMYVEYRDDHSLWEGEALHGLNCGRFYPDRVIAGTVPVGKEPLINGQQCDGPQAVWVLDRLGETSRQWPKGFFLDAWDEVTTKCGYDDLGGKLEIPEPALVALRPLLDGQPAEPGRLSDALFILARLRANAKPVAADVVRYVDSGDREVAFNSTQIIIHAAIPEVVEVVRRRVQHASLPLDAADMDTLAPYWDQLIPILGEALQSPHLDVRTEAAVDLGATHSRKAMPFLLTAISADDWETSQQAAAALAQFAATSPEVRSKLEQVAKTYWSGRVRWVAKEALEGRAVTDDPFDRCNPAPGSKAPSCIRIGPYSPDHRQPHCRDGTLHSGRYKTAAGKVVQIDWTYWQNSPVRQLPRGKFEDMSMGCRHSPTLQLLHVGNGYLAGCTGFEWMGGLIFIPDDATKPIQNLEQGSTQILVQAGGRIYVWGLDGPLEQATQTPDGEWHFKELADLPGQPDGYAVLGDSIAFVDGHTASLYDPDTGLSLLSCRD
jgi:hypothetical protein